MILNKNKKMNVGAYILSLVVVFMLIVVFFIMYKYQVEGEAIPPFNISKMVVVSSAKTENLELVEGIYNADIVQTNDIKISIQKKSDPFGSPSSSLQFSLSISTKNHLSITYEVQLFPPLRNNEPLKPTGHK